MKYAGILSPGFTPGTPFTPGNSVRETPADEALPGEGDLPGDEPAEFEAGTTQPQETYVSPADEMPAQAADDDARDENRDARIATALAMYQTGQGRDVVCDWLAGECPQSIGTRERAAKALAGHNAGF